MSDPFSYKDVFTVSPIGAAVKSNNVERVKQLLASKVELNLPDNQGYTCLHEAVETQKYV